MSARYKLLAAAVTAAAVVGVTATSGIAQDTGNNTVRPLKVNQTEGYFGGQTQVFTYAQQFFCTIEAFDDLDGIGRQGDGVPAAADPDEMILPACITGETEGGSEPTIDPTGLPVEDSRPLFTIVPSFDASGNGIPDGIDPNPGVDLQCFEPGPPTTEERKPFGSCTMHPSFVLVDPVLDEFAEELGLPLPNPTDGFAGIPGELPIESPVALPTVSPGVAIPLPNHSHIVETEMDPQSWWQIIVVLVNDRDVWPDFDGDCPAGPERCLTSVDALRASQAEGGSGRDIPSNIWLFFANEPLDHSGHGR